MAFELTQALAEPLDAFFRAAVTFLPNMFYSAVLLVIGWALGTVVGRLVKALMVRFKLDNYLSSRWPIFKLSELLPLVFEWVVYLAFVSMAAEALGVAAITEFVNFVVGFIPGIAEAIAVFVVGYIFADYTSAAIARSGVGFSAAMSKISFWLIIYGTAAVSLPLIMANVAQTGGAVSFATIVFEVGLAIAFGLGLKGVIAEAASRQRKG